MTEPTDAIELLDEEGHPHAFTLIDVVEVEDRRYAVLQPEPLEGGAVLFRVEGDALKPVDDDREFAQVVEALRESEEYDDLVIAGEDAV